MDPLLTGTKTVIRIVVHIDTLCPWCYVQKRSLDVATTRYKAAHPDLDFEIIFKPFILNPLLRDGMSIIPPLFKKYSLLLLLYELYKKKETRCFSYMHTIVPLLESTLLTPTAPTGCDKRRMYEVKVGQQNIAAYLARINTVGSLYGISFSFVGRSGPSQSSHTLAALVLKRLGAGAQGRVLDRLFAGYFENGRDITDKAWLVELGAQEGLAAEDVQAVLSSEEAGWLVEQQATAAKAEDGVEAVPSVTIQERFRVGGYQESAVFEALFDRVRAEMLTDSPPRARPQ
jgi:predicted DsbA family dithiol-disulfide isomerase